MKTFADLEFEAHSLPGCSQAKLLFPNGWGISVVTSYDLDGELTGALGGSKNLKGMNPLHCGPDTYEVAILKGGRLCYDSGLTNDVLGFQTEQDITDLMAKLQKKSAPTLFTSAMFAAILATR